MLHAPSAISKSEKKKEIARAEKSDKGNKKAEKVESLADKMKPVSEINDVADLSRWMTYYYLHPQPELVVTAIKVADKNGLMEGDAVAPFQAFLSRVFAKNPEQISPWFTQLGTISDNSKSVILTAIWWANTAEGKKLLDNIAASLPEKPREQFKKQIDRPFQDPDKMAITSPDVLDVLWGCYSATGDEKYVKRLMSTLPWTDSQSKDLNKLLIASAASWSLTSNIEQHPAVKDICLSVQESDPALKPYLAKVFADVEKAQQEGASKGKEKSKMTAETESVRN